MSHVVIKCINQLPMSPNINCKVTRKMPGSMMFVSACKDPNHLATVWECRPIWELTLPRPEDECKVGFFRDTRCDPKCPGAKTYHEHMINEYVYVMDIPNLF